MNISCADYMRKFIDTDKLNYHAALAIQALDLIPFDTIAYRGMSGCLIAPIVAVAMRKHMIMVRKTGDSTHSDRMVEGNKGAKRYVIVDDFVSTGETGLNIQESVASFAPKAKYVGILGVQYISTRLLAYTVEQGIPYPLEDEQDRYQLLYKELDEKDRQSKKGAIGKKSK